MGPLKKSVALVLVFIVMPLLLLGLALVAVAVSLKGLAAYLGAISGAWLLFAFVLPMFTGVMAPSELVDGIRARWRRRNHIEGEPLPSWSDRRFGTIPKKPSNRR